MKIPNTYHSRRERHLSLLLIVILSFELIFGSSIAYVFGDSNASTATEDHNPDGEELLTESNVVEKGTDYTIFESEDGTNTLQMYTTDVRTENADGTYQDIDNSIQKVADNGETVYQNVNGLSDVTLPETLTASSPVTLEDGGTSISFLPISDEISSNTPEEDVAEIMESEAENEPDTGDTDGTSDENPDSTAEETAEENIFEKEDILKDDVEDLYFGSEEKNVGIRYTSPDENIHYE